MIVTAAVIKNIKGRPKMGKEKGHILPATTKKKKTEKGRIILSQFMPLGGAGSSWRAFSRSAGLAFQPKIKIVRFMSGSFVLCNFIFQRLDIAVKLIHFFHCDIGQITSYQMPWEISSAAAESLGSRTLNFILIAFGQLFWSCRVHNAR